MHDVFRYRWNELGTVSPILSVHYCFIQVLLPIEMTCTSDWRTVLLLARCIQNYFSRKWPVMLIESVYCESHLHSKKIEGRKRRPVFPANSHFLYFLTSLLSVSYQLWIGYHQLIYFPVAVLQNFYLQLNPFSKHTGGIFFKNVLVSRPLKDIISKEQWRSSLFLFMNSLFSVSISITLSSRTSKEHIHTLITISFSRRIFQVHPYTSCRYSLLSVRDYSSPSLSRNHSF